MASRRLDPPRLCGGGDQHFASRRAGLPQRVPGLPCAPAGVGRLLSAVHRIRECLLDVNGRPVSLQLLRHQHRHGRKNPLAHFRPNHRDGNRSVALDLEERVRSKWLAQRRRRRTRADRKIESKNDTGTGGGAGLEELATSEVPVCRVRYLLQCRTVTERPIRRTKKARLRRRGAPSAGFAIRSPRGMGDLHDVAPRGSQHLSCV